MYIYIYIFVYIYIYIRVNYNDLTNDLTGIMVSKGDYPQIALFQVSEIVLFTHIYIYIYVLRMVQPPMARHWFLTSLRKA